MAQQLSVFLENSPGRLTNLLDVLAKAEINIITFNIADTGEYGITRLIVSDHEKAFSAIKEAGIPVTQTQVLAVQLNDTPGELFRVAKILADNGINLEYAYSAQVKKGETAVIIFKIGDVDKANAAVTSQGFTVLNSL